ncbi:hypothetical protein A2U01_0055296 [Trifolium medium]|uniref:Uncharacterized protein n=1 Tax=Trifolium medium TaxID=97028 RepID=A0A392RBQ2_9FABA|nr:hypothetical protein [Trifolium medium]
MDGESNGERDQWREMDEEGSGEMYGKSDEDSKREEIDEER